MQAAVYTSLGLISAYPLTIIKVTLLRGTARAAGLGNTSSIAAAAAQPAARGRAIFKAAIADQPVGQLPPNIGFLLIASPVLLIPAQPFGPGLTAKACDENGNILNPIGEGQAASWGFEISTCLRPWSGAQHLRSWLLSRQLLLTATSLI
jgi:hypothetical protein